MPKTIEDILQEYPELEKAMQKTGTSKESFIKDVEKLKQELTKWTKPSVNFETVKDQGQAIMALLMENRQLKTRIEALEGGNA